MKKGFTLIELLAVIVILAIIALIATPIVLSIISDAKESAILRTAEFYLDGVEHAITRKSMTTGRSYKPDICIVQTNGDLLCDNKDTLEVNVNGEKPSSGNINFKKGVISDITLILGEKNVSKNENGELFSYVIPDKICSKATSPILGNVPSGEYTFGDEYVCKVNEDTSYNFIIVNSNDEYVYLISPKNIESNGDVVEVSSATRVNWITKEDFIESGGTERLWNADLSTYPEEVGKYTYGPVTALKYLSEVTKNWYYISNLNEYYTDEYGHYTIYLSEKARLMSISEGNMFYYISNSYNYAMSLLMETSPSGDWGRFDHGSSWNQYGSISNYGDSVIVGGMYPTMDYKETIVPVIKVSKSKIAN